tara:strand:- start:191 stop:478 length:288 start_codon:yes stop_codon:yes gene_type:complete
MSKKIVQIIVIFLAVLILFCFAAVILGIYLKISGNQNNFNNRTTEQSLNLMDDEKIISFEVLNEDKLLIIISKSNDTFAMVYDIKQKKIISKINK